MTKTTTTTMCTRTDRIMAALAIGLTGGAAWAMTSLASTPSTQPRVHLAAASTVIAAAEPCKPGYVWRDKFDGDALCVTPAERDAAHAENPNRQPGGGAYGPNTCKPGYVWRDKFDGDALCVTPAERDAAHAENPNRQPGGGAYGPNTCKPGYVWRNKFDGDALCVTPAERDAAHAKNDAAPADKSQHRVDHHRGSGVVPRGERDRTSPDEE
jgi:hypothetical protein